MTFGQEPKAFRATAEQITIRKKKKTDLSKRFFQLTGLKDAGIRAHLPPPVISRYHAG